MRDNALIDTSVTAHLLKYFELARTRYSDGDWALATFFALTVIEECGKILYLRDANAKERIVRKQAFQHEAKYFTAVVNLLEASDRFDGFPKLWREEVLSWFNGRRLMQLRNNSLYLKFDRNGKFTVPNSTIKSKHAALLVYMAGVAAHGEADAQVVPGIRCRCGRSGEATEREPG